MKNRIFVNNGGQLRMDVVDGEVRDTIVVATDEVISCTPNALPSAANGPANRKSLAGSLIPSGGGETTVLSTVKYWEGELTSSVAEEDPTSVRCKKQKPLVDAVKEIRQKTRDIAQFVSNSIQPYHHLHDKCRGGAREEALNPAYWKEAEEGMVHVQLEHSRAGELLREMHNLHEEIQERSALCSKYIDALKGVSADVDKIVDDNFPDGVAVLPKNSVALVLRLSMYVFEHHQNLKDVPPEALADFFNFYKEAIGKVRPGLISPETLAAGRGVKPTLGEGTVHAYVRDILSTQAMAQTRTDRELEEKARAAEVQGRTAADALQKRVDELTHKSEICEKEASKLRDDLSKAEQERRDLVQQVASLTGEVEGSRQRIQEHLQSINEADQREVWLQGRLNQAKRGLRSTEEELTKERTAHGEAQKNLSRAASDRQRLEQQGRRLENDNDELQKDLEKLKTADARCRRQQGKIEELIADLEEKTDEIKLIKERYAETRQARSMLELTSEDLRERDAKIGRLEKRQEELRKERDELSSSVASLEEEKTRWIQELKEAVEGQTALEMQLAEERRTNNELEAQLAKCRNDLDSVQSQLNLEIKAREEVQLRHVELKAYTSRLKTRLQDLKGELSAVEVRLEDSEAREEQLREVCQGLQSDIDSLETQADSLEFTNGELEREKERLEGEKERLGGENERLKNKVHGLESDLSVAGSNIAVHSIESIGSKALSEEACRRASAVELQLTTARKQHEAAVAQLELQHKESSEAALRHNDSMASLMESNRARIQEIEKSHQTTLLRLTEEHAKQTAILRGERDDAVKARQELIRRHAAEVNRLTTDHTTSIEQTRQELEREHVDVINELKQQHAAEIKRLAIDNESSVEKTHLQLRDDHLREVEVYRLSYLESIRGLVAAGWSSETNRSPESETAADDEPSQAPEELQRQHRDAVDALLRRHQQKVEELTAAGRKETETNAAERERLARQYDQAKEELQAVHQKRIEEVVSKQKAEAAGQTAKHSTELELVRGQLKTTEKTVQHLRTAHQDELARIRAENAELRRKAEQANHDRHIVKENLSSAVEAAGRWIDDAFGPTTTGWGGPFHIQKWENFLTAFYGTVEPATGEDAVWTVDTPWTWRTVFDPARLDLSRMAPVQRVAALYRVVLNEGWDDTNIVRILHVLSAVVSDVTTGSLKQRAGLTGVMRVLKHTIHERLLTAGDSDLASVASFAIIELFAHLGIEDGITAMYVQSRHVRKLQKAIAKAGRGEAASVRTDMAADQPATEDPGDGRTVACRVLQDGRGLLTRSRGQYWLLVDFERRRVRPVKYGLARRKTDGPLDVMAIRLFGRGEVELHIQGAEDEKTLEWWNGWILPATSVVMAELRAVLPVMAADPEGRESVGRILEAFRVLVGPPPEERSS
ncbi:hypothetical protein DL769_000634 [Monosporascus sp. CRB-8-3]|nr:hypothetical protein DL769_000634 [Monosporascus sp. CRB-8-3]